MSITMEGQNRVNDIYSVGRVADCFKRVEWFEKYETLEKCFDFPDIDSFIRYAEKHRIVHYKYIEVFDNKMRLKYCPPEPKKLKSYILEERSGVNLYELDFSQIEKVEVTNDIDSIETLVISYKDFEPDIIDKYHVKALTCNITKNTDMAKLKDIKIPLSLIIGSTVKKVPFPENTVSLDITTKKKSINFDLEYMENLKNLKLTAPNCQLSLPPNLERLELKAFELLNEDLTKVFPASLKYLSLSLIRLPDRFELPSSLEELNCLGTDIRFTYPLSIRRAHFDSCFASLKSPGELPNSLEEVTFSDHGAPIPKVSGLSNLRKLRVAYLGMASCESEGTKVVLPENLEVFESNDSNVTYIFNDKLINVSLGSMLKSKTMEKNNFPSGLKFLHVSDCAYMQLQNLPPGLQLLAIEDGSQSSSFSVNLPSTLKMLILTSSYIDDIELNEGLEYVYMANGGKTNGNILKKLPESVKILSLHNLFLEGDFIDLSGSKITEFHLSKMNKYKIKLPETIKTIQTFDPKESLDNLDYTNMEVTVTNGKC